MKKIFNCIVVDDEPIAREIIETFIEKTPNLKLIESFKNAIEALNFSSELTIDVYFLDIHMPEINGLSFAKLIPKNTNVIFTTAHREYALDGFNLQALDYLLKPISFDRFLQAVQKLKTQDFKKNQIPVENKKTTDFLFIRAERKMVKISFDRILYIESLSDYIKIHLTDETVVTRETITHVYEKLPENQFLRIHRSYIISIDKIQAFTNEYIEINQQALPISRSYKESVLQKLAEM